MRYILSLVIIFAIGCDQQPRQDFPKRITDKKDDDYNPFIDPLNPACPSSPMNPTQPWNQ